MSSCRHGLEMGGQACIMEEEMEMEMVGLQVKARRSSVGVSATVAWDLRWVPALVEELGHTHWLVGVGGMLGRRARGRVGGGVEEKLGWMEEEGGR